VEKEEKGNRTVPKDWSATLIGELHFFGRRGSARGGGGGRKCAVASKKVEKQVVSELGRPSSQTRREKSLFGRGRREGGGPGVQGRGRPCSTR